MPLKPTRCRSLDALRGLAVFIFLLSVFLPGVLNHFPEPTNPDSVRRHLAGSVWHGIATFDLIMPAFLFCAGAAAAANIEAQPESNRSSLFWSGVARAIVVFVIGLCLTNAGFLWNGHPLRWLGPLQQIGIAIPVAVSVALFLPRGSSLLVVVLLTANLGFLLDSFTAEPFRDTQLRPVFPYGFQSNLAASLDSQFLPGSKSFGNWDGFGLISTGMALVPTLVGVAYQRLVLGRASGAKIDRCLTVAFVLGAVAIVAGWLLSAEVPVNATLQTPSFVLVACGTVVVVVTLLEFLYRHVNWLLLEVLQALGRQSLGLAVVSLLVTQLPLTAFHIELCQQLPAGFQMRALIAISVLEIILLLVSAIFLTRRGRYVTANRLLSFLFFKSRTNLPKTEQPAAAGITE